MATKTREKALHDVVSLSSTVVGVASRRSDPEGPRARLEKPAPRSRRAPSSAPILIRAQGPRARAGQRLTTMTRVARRGLLCAKPRPWNASTPRTLGRVSESRAGYASFRSSRSGRAATTWPWSAILRGCATPAPQGWSGDLTVNLASRSDGTSPGGRWCMNRRLEAIKRPAPGHMGDRWATISA